MKRSGLIQKVTLSAFNRFSKKFREDYKAENGESFKGNVLEKITMGVIAEKKLPDIDDIFRIMKLGNPDIAKNDEAIEAKLQTWLEDEENKDKGLDGAFCALCKDLCSDIGYNKKFCEQFESIEQSIVNNYDKEAKTKAAMESLRKLLDMNKKANEEESKTEVKESDGEGV